MVQRFEVWSDDGTSSKGTHKLGYVLTAGSTSSIPYEPWISSTHPPTPDNPTGRSPMSTPWSSGYPITPKTPDGPLLPDNRKRKLAVGKEKAQTPLGIDLSHGHTGAAQVKPSEIGRYLMVRENLGGTYLQITGLPRDTSIEQVGAFISVSILVGIGLWNADRLQSIAKVRAVLPRQLQRSGSVCHRPHVFADSQVVLIFNDSREGAKLHKHIQQRNLHVVNDQYVELHCVKTDKAVVEQVG